MAATRPAVPTIDDAAARIAAAIGEPARARMLYSLLDGRARTSTELALVADVTPSTASVHLARLRNERLVRVAAQGKHRYYRLEDSGVADVLEALSVAAGFGARAFEPSTPIPLRAARSCYDHLAGALGVALHDALVSSAWARPGGARADDYEVTPAGARGLAALGVDVDAGRSSRRRFAFACVDWSERRPHLGGALGAALLDVALARRWVTRGRDTRALALTIAGRRELRGRLGLRLDDRDAVTPRGR